MRDPMWTESSTRIDYRLTYDAERVCSVSLAREDMTKEQSLELGSFLIRHSPLSAACDGPAYSVMIRDRDDTLQFLEVTHEQCTEGRSVDFEPFNDWARSFGCSYTAGVTRP